jgi:endonuclease YncB( thermonuclease family)
MYKYLALVTEIVSEESIMLTIDLGFNVLKNQEFRLAGIDFSEFRGNKNPEKSALIKKTLTEALLNKEVTLKALKSEKSGTYLAFVYLAGKETSYNDQLIDSGLLKAFVKRAAISKK